MTTGFSCAFKARQSVQYEDDFAQAGTSFHDESIGRRHGRSAPRLRRRAAVRRKPKELASLAAAYQEGLGLAAVVVIEGPDGIRIKTQSAEESASADEAEPVAARWWCRSAAQAMPGGSPPVLLRGCGGARLRTITTATSRPAASGWAMSPIQQACAAIRLVARRLNIALQSDEEIAAEADDSRSRVDGEMQRLQQRRWDAGRQQGVSEATASGNLRTRRSALCAMSSGCEQYKENLVRQVASSLRSILGIIAE